MNETKIRAAIAALSQNKVFPADVKFAVNRLNEALQPSEEPEEIARQAREQAAATAWDTELAYIFSYALLEACNMATEAAALKAAYESKQAENEDFIKNFPQE